MGCFGYNTKPSLAIPCQTSESSANIEEKRDTQVGKSEDEMFEEVLKKEPKNVEALKVVVYGMIRRGKTKEALKYVGRLIDIDPEEVEWRLLEALCYEMLGQLSKAKSLFKEILEERPLLIRALHVWFLNYYICFQFIHTIQRLEIKKSNYVQKIENFCFRYNVMII